VNNKNLIKGVVTKTSFKIATISIKKKIKHKNYNKYINVSKNHIAHDPTNKCKKRRYGLHKTISSVLT
jgi:ribosomal protein S17